VPRISARIKGFAAVSRSLIHPLLQASQISFSLKEASLTLLRTCLRLPSSILNKLMETSGSNSRNSQSGNTCSREAGDDVMPHAKQSIVSYLSRARDLIAGSFILTALGRDWSFRCPDESWN
jgi:hypothetical protein